MEIDTFVSNLVRATDARPEYLLHHLYEIQQRVGFIPRSAIEVLSRLLGQSRTRIRGVIGFYSFLNIDSPGEFDLRISDNITDQMLGSQTQPQSLCEN